MFATKGRLKVALLVVGVLVVGLGMYTGVQVDDVMGHGLDDHDTRYTTHKALFSDKTDDDAEMDCWSCGKKRPAKKRVRKYHTWKYTWHAHLDPFTNEWVNVYIISSEYTGVYKETNWIPKGKCPNSNCTTNNN